ncbi:MAG TPA: hypothetical protein VFM48_05860 [Aquabacterium sp.]|nr:hypothetical protein [Aquabacterium sp.]
MIASLQRAVLNAWHVFGLPGLLGVSLLATCAWGYGQWLPEQQAQRDVLASQVRHLRHDLQAASASPAKMSDRSGWDVRGLVPAQAWQSVWETLPDASQRLALLAAVTSSAVKLGVQPPSIQLQGKVEAWSIHQGEALWRQRLTMPVSGRYADVRAWLGTLLSQPALSLDAVDLSRGDTSSDQVKGQVSVSLWWRVPTEGAR